MKVEILNFLKCYANGNGIFVKKINLLNATNGHYMDHKINFMACEAEINNIYALPGAVMKKM